MGNRDLICSINSTTNSDTTSTNTTNHYNHHHHHNHNTNSKRRTVRPIHVEGDSQETERDVLQELVDLPEERRHGHEKEGDEEDDHHGDERRDGHPAQVLQAKVEAVGDPEHGVQEEVEAVVGVGATHGDDAGQELVAAGREKPHEAVGHGGEHPSRVSSADGESDRVHGVAQRHVVAGYTSAHTHTRTVFRGLMNYS